MLTEIDLSEDESPATDKSQTPADGLQPFSLLEGDELPSGRKAVVIGMRGKVQRAFTLAMQRKTPTAPQDACNALVLGCLESLDGKAPTMADVLAMHGADWLAVLLRARRRTWQKDNLVTFEWTCAPPYVTDGCDASTIAKDRRKIKKALDLDSLTSAPAEQPRKATLPGGKVLTYDPPTASGSLAYAKLRRGESTYDTFQAILSRGVKLDGERATEEMLDDLGAADIDAINAELKRRGGPRTDFASTCPRCGGLYESNIEALPGFFSPRASGR